MATVRCIKQKDGERAQTSPSPHHQFGKDDDGDIVSRHWLPRVSGRLNHRNNQVRRPLVVYPACSKSALCPEEEEVRKRFIESMPESDTDTRRQAYFRAMRRAEGQSLIIRTAIGWTFPGVPGVTSGVTLNAQSVTRDTVTLYKCHGVVAINVTKQKNLVTHRDVSSG